MTDIFKYVKDRAWFVRLYGEIIPELKRGDNRPHRRTNHALSSVDLAYYGISLAKDWVSGDCGTKVYYQIFSTHLTVSLKKTCMTK